MVWYNVRFVDFGTMTEFVEFGTLLHFVELGTMSYFLVWFNVTFIYNLGIFDGQNLKIDRNW